MTGCGTGMPQPTRPDEPNPIAVTRRVVISKVKGTPLPLEVEALASPGH